MIKFSLFWAKIGLVINKRKQTNSNVRCTKKCEFYKKVEIHIMAPNDLKRNFPFGKINKTKKKAVQHKLEHDNMQ